MASPLPPRFRNRFIMWRTHPSFPNLHVTKFLSADEFAPVVARDAARRAIDEAVKSVVDAPVQHVAHLPRAPPRVRGDERLAHDVGDRHVEPSRARSQRERAELRERLTH